MLREHRGPKEIVPDIRVRAKWSGAFEIPCARCLEPVRQDLNGDFDLLFRPLVLAVLPSPVFNLVSIFPNICLLLGAFLITLSRRSDIQVLIAGSFSCGAILTVAVIGSGLPRRLSGWASSYR